VSAYISMFLKPQFFAVHIYSISSGVWIALF
jgi:hypothetical protein